jgi:hypothetical protein
MLRQLPAVCYSFLLILCSCSLVADDRDERQNPSWLLPVPEVDADPKIPTLEEVVGHGWAEDVSSHAEIERYLHVLAAATKDRTRLETYGKTYEGRSLYYLVISSPENIEKLDDIRRDNLRLADPLGTSPDDARMLTAESPAIVWLAYGVHGNETSSCDAALVTAYHLLADKSEKTREALERLVVIIDPMENPDGRERFINVYRETRGVFPQSEPASSEHIERWPGGRFNHYLFDMNRDWFLQSQVESRGKVAAYLTWHPQIYVDAHEMGRDSHYYFDPPTDPINDLILPRQREWFHRLGKHQAARFDQYGFAYTTREMFDAFYPGYGSTWPTMHGGIGILWEQAGVRGTVIDKSDETKLHYHDAVRHHYISGLATIEVAVEHRQKLLDDFHQARSDAVRLGREGPVRDFFLLEGKTPYRAARLAAMLVQNGIDVRRVEKSLKATTTSINDGTKQERTIPAGSYHVPLAQPASRLARSILERHSNMGEEFIKRQLDRLERRLPDEIYDITSWSLPLAFGVTCLATHDAIEVESEPAAEPAAAGTVVGGPAKIAYLVSSEDEGAPFALGHWLRAGLRVHVADQPLKLAGVDFAKGTLILKVHENPDSLHDHVAEAAHKFGLKIHATDTGSVDHGAHFGGPDVRWVKPPTVAMLVDRPAGYTVGHTWYLFDQVWQYPVTRVAGRSLGSLDLTKYNVLILPDGNYSDGDAPKDPTVSRLKDWVRSGGTLILVKGAAAWGAGDKVKLLATKAEKKPPKPSDAKLAAESSEPLPVSSAAAGSGPEKQEGEPPDAVPGAFLRASVYDDHWVTFGMNRTTDILMNGNLVLAPLKATDGRNLVTFVSSGNLLTSGFCWPDTLKQIAGKPYVLYQSLGDGHVIGFTDDPNFRAMCPETQRLFLNAVLLGPGH